MKKLETCFATYFTHHLGKFNLKNLREKKIPTIITRVLRDFHCGSTVYECALAPCNNTVVGKDCENNWIPFSASYSL